MSSVGYTTPFIFSVYLTPSDFNVAFLWYISISPGLYPFSIIFSALFESRLVLLTELSNEFSHCSAVAVPASFSGDVETSMEVTTNER